MHETCDEPMNTIYIHDVENKSLMLELNLRLIRTNLKEPRNHNHTLKLT